MRVAMVENPQRRAGPEKERTAVIVPEGVQEPALPSISRYGELSWKDSINERSLLLPHHSTDSEQSGIRFYTYLLKQPRFVAAASLYMVNSIILASLDATLTLHVEENFQWGSCFAGIMFLALQAPAILLSPFFGWLRDRVGTRYPTAITFLLMAPDLCVMGSAGDWANGDRAKAIYIASVVVLGILLSSLNCVGSIEGAREYMIYSSFRVMLTIIKCSRC